MNYSEANSIFYWNQRKWIHYTSCLGSVHFRVTYNYYKFCKNFPVIHVCNCYICATELLVIQIDHYLKFSNNIVKFKNNLPYEDKLATFKHITNLIQRFCTLCGRVTCVFPSRSFAFLLFEFFANVEVRDLILEGAMLHSFVQAFWLHCIQALYPLLFLLRSNLFPSLTSRLVGTNSRTEMVKSRRSSQSTSLLLLVFTNSGWLLKTCSARDVLLFCFMSRKWRPTLSASVLLVCPTYWKPHGLHLRRYTRFWLSQVASKTEQL